MFISAAHPIMIKNWLFIVFLVVCAWHSWDGAQSIAQSALPTDADQLRGSITPERAWWDLMHYDLKLEVFPETKSIAGSNTIRFVPLTPELQAEILPELEQKDEPHQQRMQIDLQQPLKITKVLHKDAELKFTRNHETTGNVYWIEFVEALPVGTEQSIQVFYSGVPTVAKRPPWDGGFTWQTDEKGNHFIATSCQGVGASLWWPCKDHGYDEPDDGTNISITVPAELIAVSNGRLQSTDIDPVGNKKTFQWVVTQPINNYSINVNIGNYVNFSDTYRGEFGKLDLDYWVLEHQREQAIQHFREVPRTIAAFEHWFGKYPFYEDSYKLVVVPYTGMEHQSSVTYGNGFKNGYRGEDVSGTGIGMKFDFIIVHESGHEWFGNNISMKDSADMWIHESFTNYSENLFVEYHFSKREAEAYVIGCRKNIKNDAPIIAEYNLNQSGSKDMYYKGGNILHTLRQIVDDDEKWRQILRGLNKTFWHQTVTTEQIENYLSEQIGRELRPFFDQYLRSTKIPCLEYQIDGRQLKFQFTNIVDGFSMPVLVRINGLKVQLNPTGEFQELMWTEPIKSIEVDKNFLIESTEK